MKKVFLLLLFYSTYFYAQIDTNIIYPLQIGNIWEYTDYNYVHRYEQVVGFDTLDNDKVYARIMNVNLIDADTFYQNWRADSVSVYLLENDEKEIKMVDTSIPEGGWWPVGDDSTLGMEIIHIERYFNTFFQDTLTLYNVENIFIDTTVAPPEITYMDIWIHFTKGVGITRNYDGAFLSGAKIGENEYGFITVGIKEESEITEVQNLNIESYPNPFNSMCNIRFYNPKYQNARIEIYNLLGQKVSTLFDGNLYSGQVEFNYSVPSRSSSGIYLIILNLNKTQYSKKIMYLK